MHELIIERHGGLRGLRDPNALEAAVAQPKHTYARTDLYPTLSDKAAALAYSLVLNHPFIDGNKRVGHAATETFLVLNGHEIDAGIDEQESLMIDLASGKLSREALAQWIASHLRQILD